jgi:transcriptional regulator
MYVPTHFAEERLPVLQDFMRQHPLATLVTLSASELIANHVPLCLIDPAPHGKLISHLRRANNQWRDIDGASSAGDLHRTAGLCRHPGTRQAETGKVVPTWNYGRHACASRHR